MDAVRDLPERHAGVLAEREGDVLEDGERVEEGGALEHEAGALPERQHRFFAHALDVGPEERHLPGVGPDQPVRDAQEHGLARAAPAHDGQRGALAEGQAHALEHRLVPEGLPHLSELDGNLGSGRHGIHHQKRMKKSLVRKKSEMITAMATWTTVSVVERPSPSVPPSVPSPL